MKEKEKPTKQTLPNNTTLQEKIAFPANEYKNRYLKYHTTLAAFL